MPNFMAVPPQLPGFPPLNIPASSGGVVMPTASDVTQSHQMQQPPYFMGGAPPVSLYHLTVHKIKSFSKFLIFLPSIFCIKRCFLRNIVGNSKFVPISHRWKEQALYAEVDFSLICFFTDRFLKIFSSRISVKAH